MAMNMELTARCLMDPIRDADSDFYFYRESLRVRGVRAGQQSAQMLLSH
jgi:hypothetical protein